MDPRLLRHAGSTRRFLGVTVTIGVATALLIIAQAFLLARVVVAGFQDGATLSSQRVPLLLLAGVLAGRVLLAWATEAAAHASAASAKSELRGAVLEHAVRLGPVWLSGTRTGELTTLTTRGIDALDGYFSRYLPQLVLAGIVPLAVVVAMATQDVLSAVLVLVTLPLIPLFMIVIGTFTKRQVDQQWAALSRLSGHFLDVVAGLPTLKIFGRSAAQATTIAEVGDRYRRTTMGVLRVSFLSALVLELVATLSVAVVAVAIGLRLVYGGMTLTAALTVLLLAPEAYLPIRLVGQQFHAAAEGLGAAERMVAVLETPVAMRGVRSDIPDLTRTSIVLDRVTVSYPGRREPALDEESLVIEPGVVTAVSGVNGAGKSTLLALLMGFIEPSAGEVRLRSTVTDDALDSFDADAWRSRIAYVPQAPYLGEGRLGALVRLGAPDATDDEVLSALTAAGLDLGDPGVRATLPAGLDTRVGEGGVGLSAGQVRRVALARALCRDAALVLLDEPTSALDSTTERVVVDSLAELRSRGTTVVVVAHRPAVLVAADRVVVIEATERPTPEPLVQEAEALAGTAATAQPWTERA
jgi:thiol reductant ABC exporter CydD subunit